MSDKPVDTLGRIHADLFAGRITSQQAADRTMEVLRRPPILGLLLCSFGFHVWQTDHAWLHKDIDGEKHFVSWVQRCQRCPEQQQKMKELT